MGLLEPTLGSTAHKPKELKGTWDPKNKPSQSQATGSQSKNGQGLSSQVWSLGLSPLQGPMALILKRNPARGEVHVHVYFGSKLDFKKEKKRSSSILMPEIIH